MLPSLCSHVQVCFVNNGVQRVYVQFRSLCLFFDARYGKRFVSYGIILSPY